MRKLLLLVVALVLVGCGSNVPTPTFGSQPTFSPEPHPPAIPASISVPAIEAESTLIQLGKNPDGTLETPDVQTPLQASWYTGSPRPGAPGPAVILGHVDGGGQHGIFYRLRELKSGSLVRILRDDDSVATFEVYEIVIADKDSFPTERVYGNTEAPELRLITCGGAFNRSVRSYEDNIIAFARLTVQS